MANVTIAADDRGVFEVPLVGGVVTTVQVVTSRFLSDVEVYVHSGSQPVYVRSGVTVVPKDPKSQIVPVGAFVEVSVGSASAGTIALVSAAAAVVSVVRA